LHGRNIQGFYGRKPKENSDSNCGPGSAVSPTLEAASRHGSPRDRHGVYNIFRRHWIGVGGLGQVPIEKIPCPQNLKSSYVESHFRTDNFEVLIHNFGQLLPPATPMQYVCGGAAGPVQPAGFESARRLDQAVI
jgi:hypothetical protein